jgi:hypothetical protein
MFICGVSVNENFPDVPTAIDNKNAGDSDDFSS